MHTSLKYALSAAFALAAVNAAHAEINSPVFGHAIVQPTTESQNKNVVGKGYYADFYGYYGNYYSAYASMYGSLGSYYKSASYYSYAESYASSAANYYYYASYYQTYGG
jgi:hypothetical protein